MMNKLLVLLTYCLLTLPVLAQDPSTWLSNLPHAKDYVQHRVSSYDRSGGNGDARTIAAGETLTLLDEAGPGLITHVWVTIASDDPNHLKALVLRMYWDGDASPSVEAPIGDFFGLGLGDYHLYQSLALSVGADKALNSFFPMPFQKHARITVTNEGTQRTDAFYFNIDYRAYTKPLPGDLLYFHAQYRQAAPAHGWTNQWRSNGDAIINDKKNLNGDGNYVWMEATGRGHFVGVTMSVLENQDGWWGEGDDMFFVDGEALPSINGTGSEDYFLGAWDFGGVRFRMGCMARRSWGRKLPAGGGRCTDFIWIRRSHLRNRCGRRLSTGMPTTGRIIIFPLRTGIRPSRMRHFRRCRRWSRGFRGFMRWAGRGMRGSEPTSWPRIHADFHG
jgi:hypothetical protein